MFSSFKEFITYFYRLIKSWFCSSWQISVVYSYCFAIVRMHALYVKNEYFSSNKPATKFIFSYSCLCLLEIHAHVGTSLRQKKEVVVRRRLYFFK